MIRSPLESTVKNSPAYHTVGVEREALEGQKGVIRLNDNITTITARRCEDRVGLNELLGEAIVEPLEQKGAQTRARAACNAVCQHKALQTITIIGLSIQFLKNLFIMLLSMLISCTRDKGKAVRARTIRSAL